MKQRIEIDRELSTAIGYRAALEDLLGSQFRIAVNHVDGIETNHYLSYLYAYSYRTSEIIVIRYADDKGYLGIVGCTVDCEISSLALVTFGIQILDSSLTPIHIAVQTYVRHSAIVGAGEPSLNVGH